MSTTTPAALVTVAWWRILLERLLRQAAQTAVPVLTPVVQAGGAVSLDAVLLGLAGVEAVTLLKAAVLYVLDVHVDPAAPWWQQALDRSVPAAAGVLAGIPLASWADAVATDWTSVGKAAVVAAVLAQIATYAAPAKFTHRRGVAA